MTKYNKTKHYWSLKNQAKLDSLIVEKGDVGCYCHMLEFFYTRKYYEFSERQKFAIEFAIDLLSEKC